MATWAPVVFWALLVPLLIVMLIVYLRSKRFYRLVYILAVFTYAMMIMYWIDAYKLGRNAIIALLAASSLVMILIGYLMHKKAAVKKKVKTKSWQLAVGCVAVIAVIVALSSSNIGWSIQEKAVESIALKDILTIREADQPDYGPGPSIPVYTITIANTFIPRQYELPYATACLYNSKLKAANSATVIWYPQSYSDFGPAANTVEVFSGSKTATLKLTPTIRYKEKPMPARPEMAKNETEVYDQLLLFLGEKTGARVFDYAFQDCYNLQANDFATAVKIPITS